MVCVKPWRNTTDMGFSFRWQRSSCCKTSAGGWVVFPWPGVVASVPDKSSPDSLLPRQARRRHDDGQSGWRIRSARNAPKASIKPNAQHGVRSSRTPEVAAEQNQRSSGVGGRDPWPALMSGRRGGAQEQTREKM